MEVVIATIVVFGLAMLIMAVGLLVRGRSTLRGSCGGVKPIGPDGEPMTCDHCTCENDNAH